VIYLMIYLMIYLVIWQRHYITTSINTSQILSSPEDRPITRSSDRQMQVTDPAGTTIAVANSVRR